MSEKVLLKGNEALAQAALLAGCRDYYAYPITPQNEISAYMSKHMPEVGGRFLQAESEIAAVNMVLGVAAIGKKAMTSSSGPGISLKQETLSTLAGLELPLVIVNMMRGAPGLGSIGGSQGDYQQSVNGGGHGDYHQIVLAPSNAQEMFFLTLRAFELAFKYRMVTMILGDAFIGQSMQAAQLPTDYKAPKVDLSWALGQPGQARGKSIKSLRLAPGGMARHINHLGEKYSTIIEAEQDSEYTGPEDCEILVVAYGSVSRAAHRMMLDYEQEVKGFKVGLFRPITLWPFPIDSLVEKINKGVKRIVTIEMSLGQMTRDMKSLLYGKVSTPISLFPSPATMPKSEEIFEFIKKEAAK